MKRNQSTKIVDEINSLLMKKLWFDFEVMQYVGNELVIMGSLDISDPHEIEIIFRDIFFISLPIEWKTDTSKPPLAILEGEEAFHVNQQFHVEQGYLIFRFLPEGYEEGFGCLISAKSIDYKVIRPIV